MKYFATAAAFILSSAVAVLAAPTLYLVGDSTMASHRFVSLIIQAEMELTRIIIARRRAFKGEETRV